MQMNLLLNENSIDYERITKFSELISDETNDELWANLVETVLTPSPHLQTHLHHGSELSSEVFQKYLEQEIF